jgi:hypothetical protein
MTMYFGDISHGHYHSASSPRIAMTNHCQQSLTMYIRHINHHYQYQPIPFLVVSTTGKSGEGSGAERRCEGRQGRGDARVAMICGLGKS